VPGEPLLNLDPLVVDEPALRGLADAGYRWQQGQAAGALYRWLLPPDWVLAADIPRRQANGVEPLSGGGDRAGRFTAVLTVLRGSVESPSVLVSRGAAPGARVGTFRSRAGLVAERLEHKDGKTLVMTAHAFTAGTQPLRFVIAALGAGEDAETARRLRLLGTALALHDELASAVDGARLGGRLHG
jgi:hypothetical protein